MPLLRPSVTGPVLATAIVAVVAETVALVADNWAVDGILYLFTIAAAVCACVAHLFACAIRYFLLELHQFGDHIDGRLDGYEAHGIDTVITLAAGNARPVPSPFKRPSNVYRIR
jgi:hypothetical protein